MNTLPAIGEDAVVIETQPQTERATDALLRWAYREAKNVEGAGLTEAGIFRALKRLPGVTVSTVDVLGRRVLSLAQTEDWLREELFLDPKTYEFRGQRGTVVHDTVVSPEKAGNATGAIEKGHTATSLRIATAVVDKVGER